LHDSYLCRTGDCIYLFDVHIPGNLNGRDYNLPNTYAGRTPVVAYSGCANGLEWGINMIHVDMRRDELLKTKAPIKKPEENIPLSVRGYSFPRTSPITVTPLNPQSMTKLEALFGTIARRLIKVGKEVDETEWLELS